MAKIQALRRLIYSVYDSEAQCAAVIQWSRQRLNRITNGVKEPDVNELHALAGALHRSVAEIAEIFLEQ